MSISILAIGYFDGMTGYNVHTRYFFEALATLHELVEIDLQDTERSNQKKIVAWQARCQQRPTTQPIIIHINQPDELGVYLALKGVHIVFSIWESTVYPVSWLTVLNQVDFVWTPSDWGKSVLIDNGVREEKIVVIPEGVDDGLFNTDVKPAAVLEQMPGFKFIHIGRWEERKGSELVVRVFNDVFRDIPDAYLVLLCHNRFAQGFDIEQQLASMQLNARERVLSISPVKSHATIASIIKSCHCGVFPTSAEGWGLPIMEVMACGLNTIVTDYSAPTAFISTETNDLLSYQLVDIPINVFSSQVFSAQPHQRGQWAKPDEAQLKQLMLANYNDQQRAQQQGLRAAHVIQARWTWYHAACKAGEALKALG
jgi:glycosyltransferase involved in cell wall biosynthesis